MSANEPPDANSHSDEIKSSLDSFQPYFNSSRRHPTVEEMRRWAARQRVLLEWRRIESDEPNWKRTQHISQSLSSSLKRILPQEELPCAEDLRLIWKQVAGEFNATHSSPASWHGQDLIIEVSHPALRFELQQHQAHLLERLREELAPAKVRALRFRLIG